ncbi:MAG: hypothetical protein AB1634_18355 [Thermodesulfobacteriota bacterium]
MAARRCSYCQEKIQPRAVVCPHCRRDLPEDEAPGRSLLGWGAVMASGALLAAAAVLAASAFLRERRTWTRGQGESPGS